MHALVPTRQICNSLSSVTSNSGATLYAQDSSCVLANTSTFFTNNVSSCIFSNCNFASKTGSGCGTLNPSITSSGDLSSNNFPSFLV